MGDWSELVLHRYNCSISIFEPVPAFAEKLRVRFKDSDRVVVHEFGIGRLGGKRYFQVSGDGTGAFAGGQPSQVAFRPALELVLDSPEVVSLMAVNIEGGEYELIPALDEANLLARIQVIFIQFHKVGEDWEQERKNCQKVLSKTHSLDWDYPFVWEKWSSMSSSRISNV